MKKFLDQSAIEEILDSIEGDTITVERIRAHNKGEIRKSSVMTVNELKGFIHESIEDSHQPGGDIEVWLPKLEKKLVGHHDGIYWLE